MQGDHVALSFLWMLAAVVLVMGMAYWFTRHVVGRGMIGGAQSGKQIKIMEQLSLGKDQRLLLTQVGERCFLLGVTSAGISVLAEFAAEEAASWLAQPESSEAGPSFREAVLQAIQQKWRR